MKILLTGATGYLGKNLLTKLKDKHEIFCILRASSNLNKITTNGVKYFVFYKYTDLYNILMEIKPDLIIHVAGMFVNEHTSRNITELVQSNIEFPTILLDAANNSGCKKIISTGSYWQHYMNESYNPVNLYAATKEAFDDICLYYVNAHSWRVINLEMFDVYGPQDERRKILNIVKELKDGETIELTKGEQMMFLCHINDVVSAYVQAINIINSVEFEGIKKYVVRGEEAYPLKEIIMEYLKISNKKIDIIWGGRPYKKREFMNLTKIGTVLPGWTPNYNLHEGLVNFCKSDNMKK